MSEQEPRLCHLRNPAVPPSDEWLPSGIAGRIRLPGYSHPWVMARRNTNDFCLRDDAYRLMLPEDEFQYGDGEDEWMVGTAESAFEPWPQESLIDVVATALDVEWDTSPEAWEEARAWFVEASKRPWESFTTEERRSMERLLGRREEKTTCGYFDDGPFGGPLCVGARVA
ncbi:hypothetical protein [Clavibacter nebraskensis]|nr:hypothetical protein [Clavibacter nebraskensis]QKO03361.1 hypothetical protein EGX35_05850 [Clavibacter nebraskensis]QLL36634.1 hypothetical protein EGX37_05850 [Clavibacter nebraskensis]UQB06056.1 hypothetical protein LIV34_001173 [Clavibacter nebraskensis]UQB08877.1 hypothetical protein LIX21_001173 [Clavibacter nebraskensis]UQB11711.1 hypothetical protein LIX19_001175 [Clavibacter nebraskensis]